MNPKLLTGAGIIVGILLFGLFGRLFWNPDLVFIGSAPLNLPPLGFENLARRWRLDRPPPRHAEQRPGHAGADDRRRAQYPLHRHHRVADRHGRRHPARILGRLHRRTHRRRHSHTGRCHDHDPPADGTDRLPDLDRRNRHPDDGCPAVRVHVAVADTTHSRPGAVDARIRLRSHGATLRRLDIRHHVQGDAAESLCPTCSAALSQSRPRPS